MIDPITPIQRSDKFALRILPRVIRSSAAAASIETSGLAQCGQATSSRRTWSGTVGCRSVSGVSARRSERGACGPRPYGPRPMKSRGRMWNPTHSTGMYGASSLRTSW